MPLSLNDRLEIIELLALHGQLMDEGAFERLGEVFVEDIIYDVSAFGGDRLIGVAAIVEAALALGQGNPVAHHTTNITIVDERPDGEMFVRSKGLGVRSDGSVGSVTYEDVVRRTKTGWRIRSRVVLPRRRALAP